MDIIHTDFALCFLSCIVQINIRNVYMLGLLRCYMAYVEIACPKCLNEVTFVPTAPLSDSSIRTLSCRGCNSYVEFEYSIRIIVDKPLYRDRNWLHEQYIINGKSMSAIGKMCNVSAMTIRWWMQTYEIPARGRGMKKPPSD